MNSQACGFLGQALINAADVECEVPRSFFEMFIERFKDDGLIEIISQTIKNILSVMRTKRIYEDYLPSYRAFSYLISFKPVAIIITELPEWIPTYANARSFETLSILGPFISRTGIFPDSDPAIAKKYFGSSDFAFDDSAEIDDDRYVGSRNYGEVKSAQEGLTGLSATAVVKIHEFIF